MTTYRERPNCRKVLNKLHDDGCRFSQDSNDRQWYVLYPDGRRAHLSEGLERQLRKMLQEGGVR